MDVRDELARITGLGYKVFPIVRKAKKPLTTNGLKDATTDMAQVDKWLRQHGDCNWAIAISDGVIVIDIDSLDSGEANKWPRDQEQAASLMDCGALSVTPRRGRHMWFRQPVSGKWRSTAGKLAPKVDTRGPGGYIIIPPSSTRDGEYSWLESMELNSVPADLPEPPEWLCRLLTENPGRPESSGTAMPPVECVVHFNGTVEDYVNTRAYWHSRALDTLVSAGGQFSHMIDDVIFFTRPGRDPRETHSANWNHPASRHGVHKSEGRRLGYPRLSMFTSNWAPFEGGKSYSAFDIIKALSCPDTWPKILADMETDHRDYWASSEPENFISIEPATQSQDQEMEDIAKEILVNKTDGMPNGFPTQVWEAITGHKNGIIYRTMQAIEDAEWMAQPMFRISGALALMSTLLGRKAITSCGLLSNCYFLNVAPTGEGKDAARKVISRILDETEPPINTIPEKPSEPSLDGATEMAKVRCVVNLPHSDTATLRMLEEHPCRLAMIDEIGAILATAKKSPTSLLHRQLILLTAIFTHGKGYYQPPRYADTSKNFELNTPCLSLFGFTVEKSLGEAIDSASVEGGLIPRCLMFRGLDMAPLKQGKSAKIDPELMADIRAWREWKRELIRGNLMDLTRMQEWKIEPKAEEVFNSCRVEWIGQKRFGQQNGQLEKLVYTRALELAKKLAMVFSADRIGPPGTPGWTPSITLDDAETACALVDFCMEDMEQFVRVETADGPVMRAANNIRQFLQKKPTKVFTKTAIIDSVRSVDSKHIRDQAIEYLIDRGDIKPVLKDSKGKIVTAYVYGSGEP